MMKRLACLLLFLATAAFAQRPDGPPPPERGPEKCSLATLTGDYLFAQDGLEGGKPFAQAGKESYDGAGHVKGVSTSSTNGTIKRGTYTATYTMKADCTGTLTITDSAKKTYHYDVFTTPGGNEAVWVQTDYGSVSAGWERRRMGPPPGMGRPPQ